MISSPLFSYLLGSLYHLHFKPHSEISQIIRSGGFWDWLSLILLVTFYTLSSALPFALFYGLIIAVVAVHFDFKIHSGFIFLLGLPICALWALNWTSIVFGLGEASFRTVVFLSCLPGHLACVLTYMYFARSKGKKHEDEVY